MTALEIRPEEIGAFSLEAYKARRARLMNARPAPQTPKSRRIYFYRPRHELDDEIYGHPTGPEYVANWTAPELDRDVLLVASRIDEMMREVALPQRRREILKEVAQKHVVAPQAILGKSRHKPIVLARFEYVYRLHEEMGLSFAEIGRVLGRDHTTALHAYGRFKTMLASGEVTL